MPIELKEEDNLNRVTVFVRGKLVKEDYERFVPEFERLLHLHGKLRVRFDMIGFRGWELSAAWEDFKFGVHHFKDIERIAMVGEKKWQHGMTAFVKPFTSAAVRYFDHTEAEAARTWLDAA